MSALKSHPYAEAWPLLGADELAELADDIATNGLRESIVLHDGEILDGRNRAAACGRAKVEPHFTEFEGTDDAALAYVQSLNNARRHQSKGSLAASWALSMLAAGKRSGGRWVYGDRKSVDLRETDENERRRTGIIADHAASLLTQVRDEQLSLNAAYEQARQIKDAEDEQLAEQKREEQREADAREFVEEHDPDLAASVGAKSSNVETFREAKAIWEQRNREEVEEQRKLDAEHRATVKRHVDYLRAFLSGVHFASQMADDSLRDDVLDALTSHDRDRFLRIEKEATWPTTI